MLSTSEVELIRESFSAARQNREEFAADFYTQLFMTAPDVRSMFPDDLTSQGKKLTQLLAIAVSGLDNIDTLIEPMRELGARHIKYGVKAEHYPVVAEVLIGTLATVTKEIWTEAHASAWEKALNLVASTMLEGADEAAKRSAA
ncbi:globin domain-containing protein [Phaeobacter inhibens]|uniref:globin domain-containing protein n=1 Tax=Phaeobacter inhibens TaxID=221822 RepID=UPI0021A718BC|nr:globin domain-containing protein [Phaeobacter inhibens]UWR62765.1 hypothetical protein K4F88_19285 [Phaeobacter inhibens]